ncbi:uncharacterized protein TNCV_680221 [Trichonephila clavipes]|nr:uncharacterized protein TNCV_680221 [Trichonephila clavipes]
MHTLRLLQPLIDLPESGVKGPSIERWAIIQLFHGYDASHVVSPLPFFLPLAISSPWRRFGGWERGKTKTTSVRFFSLTQNWANFSFTLEPKEVSLQKHLGRRLRTDEGAAETAWFQHWRLKYNIAFNGSLRLDESILKCRRNGFLAAVLEKFNSAHTLLAPSIA